MKIIINAILGRCKWKSKFLKVDKKILLTIILLTCFSAAILAEDINKDQQDGIQWNKWVRNTVSFNREIFKQYSIFITAIELKIFPTLGTKWLSATQVAKQLSIDPQITEILLNNLAGMEYLKKRDDMFANTKDTYNQFCKNSEERDVQLHALVDEMKRWNNLTEVVKTTGALTCSFEKRVKQNVDYPYAYPWRWTLLQWAFNSDADLIADAVDCSNVDTILDLGGGYGYYAIAFVQRYPHLKAVVFDLNNYYLNLGKDIVKKFNLEDNITFKKGDFFRDDFGNKEYDMILIFNVVHMDGAVTMPLLTKAKQYLKKGGTIVIHDYLLNSLKTKPVPTFGMDLLLLGIRVAHQRTYSEVENWLISLGFKNIKQNIELKLITAENQ